MVTCDGLVTTWAPLEPTIKAMIEHELVTERAAVHRHHPEIGSPQPSSSAATAIPSYPTLFLPSRLIQVPFAQFFSPMDFRFGRSFAEDLQDPMPKAHDRLPIQRLFGPRD